MGLCYLAPNVLCDARLVRLGEGGSDDWKRVVSVWRDEVCGRGGDGGDGGLEVCQRREFDSGPEVQTGIKSETLREWIWDP